MRNRLTAALLGIALAGALPAWGAEPSGAGPVDMDQLLKDAGSADPSVRAAAAKALEDILRQNPIGSRHVANQGVGLDVPSWKWEFHRIRQVRGVAVTFRDAGGNLASVQVDKVPGLAEGMIEGFTKGLPKEAAVSTTPMIRLGPFLGAGTRLSAVIPGPVGRRIECVVFYPEGKLAMHYIATVTSCLPGPNDVQKDVAAIVASVQAE